MKIKLFTLLLFISNIAFAQDFYKKQKLRVLTEEADTIYVNAKKDKTGSIVKLYQTFVEYAENDVFEITEFYKKDKFWAISKKKKIFKKKKKHFDIYKNVLDGYQYYFDESGKLDFILKYDSGKLIEHYYDITYYPNGNLKYIAEMVKWDFYNFLVYKYPSGENHNFGNLKDGVGAYILLDDDGFPCIECSATSKKIKAKSLCDEKS